MNMHPEVKLPAQSPESSAYSDPGTFVQTLDVGGRRPSEENRLIQRDDVPVQSQEAHTHLSRVCLGDWRLFTQG